MTKRLILRLILGALFVGVASDVGAKEAGPATQPATKPAAKSNPRHEAFVKIAKAGGVDVLFVGDSITDFWRREGRKVWARDFAPLKAANFGIAGDGTRGVLWRLQNGELEGIRPKVVVLLIGTNDLGDKPEAIAGRIKEILTEIQKRSPDSRVLLHAIFPRGAKPHGQRDKIDQINKIIATYAQADPGRITFVDFGAKFLNEDGTMNKELMPDTLHPNEKGYELWSGEILGTVRKLMAGDAKPTTTPVVPG